MKKIFMGVTALMLCLIIVGCSSKDVPEELEQNGDNSEINSEVDPKPNSDIKVAFVTGVGGKNDKSVNEATHEGLVRAESELGVTYTVIEPKSIDDFQPSLEGLVLDGNQLVVGLGFDMAPVVNDVAALYQDTKFVIIDNFVDQPNVTSMNFKEHEGSFLMGVIAGMMTESNKIGFIGGMDTSVIGKFEVGFAAGVKSVNPEAAEGLIGDSTTSGNTVKFANSFNDVNKGYELGKSLIDAGCDVVYHAAGAAGVGVFNVVKESNERGKKVWTIGVDKDQAELLPEYAPYILSSMIKKTDVASYLAVESIINGTFKGGIQELGIKDDAIGIAGSSPVNTPEEVLKLVEKYQEMIKDGTLVVPESREELAIFEPVSAE